jgi:hypothetical protein
MGPWPGEGARFCGRRNTPARTRTWNPLIKSQLLCQLSYGGVAYAAARMLLESDAAG